jgi:hypothetical protein
MPPLTLTKELNTMAQKYAEKLASMNVMKHSNRSNRRLGKQVCGENLYACWGKKATGIDASQSWYDEIKDYNFEYPSKKTGVVGHFTQLVWKDSKEVGFGVAKSKQGWYYLVANYYPAGNYIGMELQNVFPPVEE